LKIGLACAINYLLSFAADLGGSMSPIDLHHFDDLPDFDRLEFKFTRTDFMFIAQHGPDKDEWKDGKIYPFQHISISPAASVFNYGQAVFEGMKAFRSQKGNIALFRPLENAIRFKASCERLVMPSYNPAAFVNAVKQVVRANERWIPGYHEEDRGNRSLYIRPVMVGSGSVLGVGPALSYTFFIFVCPVGIYLAGKNAGKVLVMKNAHRAPEYGTGNVKASGNYMGTFLHKKQTKKDFQDILYLDAREDKYVEELSSSNIFIVKRDGTLVTPRLDGSILPGITRKSIIHLARSQGIKVDDENKIEIKDVLDAQEAFFTGTAAVIQEITCITYEGKDYTLGSGKMGEVTSGLRESLLKIQLQEDDDPEGWVVEI
jgi:branched-chain amino acid aminotransferase